MNEATPISASFVMYKDGVVVLEDDNNQHIQYPLTSFSEDDQIIPQALSSPLRGGDYGPLNGAVFTSFTSTGTNAYSLQRQEVVRLIAGMKAEGRYEGAGHGNNSRGAGVASGVYLYRSGWGYTNPLFESQMGCPTFINKLVYEVLLQVKQATHIFYRHTLSFMVHPSLHSFQHLSCNNNQVQRIYAGQPSSVIASR